MAKKTNLLTNHVKAIEPSIFHDDDFLFDDPLENSKNNHTWFAGSDFEYNLIAYCFQEVIKKLDAKVYYFDTRMSSEFEYDVDKSTSVLALGSCSFNVEGVNYIWKADKENEIHAISSNESIAKIKKVIQKYIKTENPLRRKNLQIYQERGNFICTYKAMPSVGFQEVILDKELKEEVYDNTIFQIKKLKSNNGVIFYGSPGCGKSQTVQAIIKEAVEAGFSTCFITSALQFTAFGEFLQEYLAPCICVFEDIDSYAQSREQQDNPILADFLQLLSGVSEGRDRVVFIATTNHIAALDKAVANRPMRFNRKFYFGFPNNNEIDQLLDLYFKDVTLSVELRGLCYDSYFSGSHIKEIRRTCDLMKEKHGTEVPENFSKAVKIIKDNFSSDKEKIVGFQFKKP